MLNFNRNLDTNKFLDTHVIYTEMRIGCECTKIKSSQDEGKVDNQTSLKDRQVFCGAV